MARPDSCDFTDCPTANYSFETSNHGRIGDDFHWIAVYIGDFDKRGACPSIFFHSNKIWELALGGLLALLGGNILLSEVRATGLYIVGISALLFSALTFSAETAFPGIAALVPTLGTASMLVAAKYRAGKYRGSDTAVLRYLGDRSYSIYLWHWPVIVFWKAHQSAIGFWDGLIVGALTIAISHISFRHIEVVLLSEPFWRPDKVDRRLVYAASFSSLQFVP